MTDFAKLCEWMGWEAYSIERREGTYHNGEKYAGREYFAHAGTLTPAGAVAVLEKVRAAGWTVYLCWRDNRCTVQFIAFSLAGGTKRHMGADNDPCTAVLDAALAGKVWEGE